MKTLYLLRHAKSGRGEPGQRDFDRPLDGGGGEEARLVGQLVRERRLKVDLVICSPAERARQTAALVREAAKLSAGLLYDARVYEADAARLLEVVAQAPESSGALLLVGHNPGMEELLTFLTGEGRRMQTAALACVSLEVEGWGEVPARSGRLEWLARP